MIVMKFGGATIQDAPSIENVVRIVKSKLPLQPALVVSAMGKTTRGLLNASVLASRGSIDEAVRETYRIRGGHEEVAKTLMPEWGATAGAHKIQFYFSDLDKLLNGISILRELSPQTQDKVLSYGELISTAILSETLRQRGIAARLLDAREAMVTDGRFTQARPVLPLALERIREAVRGPVLSGEVPVLQGYIGSTRDGVTTTLGFEGSDYTAALTGAALDASEIQIWKDVPGMMTADPELVPRAFTVKAVSYEEAAELTFFGAKVLHPMAVEPAVRMKIPIHIFCTRHPDSSGTLVSDLTRESKNRIKSIAYMKPIQVLRLHFKSNNAVESLSGVLNVFTGHSISPHWVSASGARAAFSFDADPRTDSLVEELQAFGEAEVLANKASISLVGSGLRDQRASAETLIRKVADEAVEFIEYGVSPIRCTFIAEEAAVPGLVNRLHDFFFDKPDPNLFE
jgi:aspartate kinase